MPWDTTLQGSAIFAQTIADAMAPHPGRAVGAGGWAGAAPPDGPPNGDLLVALFDNTITPDREVANPAYGAGAWAPAGNVGDPPNWPAAGQPLLNTTFDPAAVGSFPPFYNMFGTQLDGDNTTGLGAVTFLDVRGDLLYFPGAAGVYPNQGLAYHSFGGSQVVTAGLFTILWHDAGIAIVTVQVTQTP